MNTTLARGVPGLFLAALVLTTLAGCGDGRPQRVRVSGRVLIDGQPLTHGFVQVAPQGARAASGKIGADGRFTLGTFTEDDGCVPGKHAAAVIASEALGGTSQRWHAPKEYVDVKTSGLEVNIERATDALEINLSWKGGQPFVETFGAER